MPRLTFPLSGIALHGACSTPSAGAAPHRQTAGEDSGSAGAAAQACSSGHSLGASPCQQCQRAVSGTLVWQASKRGTVAAATSGCR